MRTSRKQGWQESRLGVARRQRKTHLRAASLPEHISHSLETIIELHKRNEQEVSRHQRFVEAVTAFFGRPAFLYSLLLVIVLWMLPNLLSRRFGLPQFDPPPFAWLQVSLSISALLMTTGVLITQNRQEKLAKQRAELTLQLNLLSEQKMAKLIALIEELRQDLPIVEDREDTEAEMMKETVDPHIVVDTLQETLAAQQNQKFG